MKDHNEVFHSQLERSTDSFSLISEYFGRCLFDNLTAAENQLAKSIFVSPELSAPKAIVPIVHTPPRLSPKLAVKTSINPFDEDDDDDDMEYDSNNPFKNDYKESKNPFKNDYDESKNPFANDP
jgi:hypothetical protein